MNIIEFPDTSKHTRNFSTRFHPENPVSRHTLRSQIATLTNIFSQSSKILFPFSWRTPNAMFSVSSRDIAQKRTSEGEISGPTSRKRDIVSREMKTLNEE